MTEIENQGGSKYPTLMKHFESDEDLDQYVIDHSYMFTVIQIRPGGFVSGYGSNYVREEIHVGDDGPEEALERAIARAKEIYDEKKKSLLIYAVADFSGAIGFNRPVRQYPPNTYRSKADKQRDAIRERKAKREAAKKKAEPKSKEKDKFKAAVFKTDLGVKKQMTEADFVNSKTPMVRVTKA